MQGLDMKGYKYFWWVFSRNTKQVATANMYFSQMTPYDNKLENSTLQIFKYWKTVSRTNILETVKSATYVSKSIHSKYTKMAFQLKM